MVVRGGPREISPACLMIVRWRSDGREGNDTDLVSSMKMRALGILLCLPSWLRDANHEARSAQVVVVEG